MQTLLQDLRYSLRQLIKSPGFTWTAVVSLALGIGATTAVFSVIYAALLNPYPFHAADRIVRLTATSKSGPGDWLNLNGPQIQQVRRLPVIESVLAMDYHALTLTGNDLPENVNEIGLISTGFNDLGVPPLLGRGLLPSDSIDGQDPQPVGVLGYQFWQKYFFANPDVVGKTVQLDHKNYLIVGVAAPRFKWYSADVYLPLKLSQDSSATCIINLYLKPGVTHEAANAALQPLLDQFAKDMPKRFPEHFKVQVEGLNEWVVRSISGTLYLLFGAVALLLAVGCGNVSILLLARGTARQHELAVRSAVGARRSRIVRQLLTESSLLAVIGAGLGVLTAYGILAGIKLLLPRYAFAPEVVININLPVLAFSVAVALATGILFGLWPALQLSRTQVTQVMQSNARRVAGSVRGRRTHNALIAGQIALTLVLLAGAGAVMKAFVRLMHEPLGYDPHHVISIPIPLHDNSYTTWAARGAYFEQLRAKVAETPGVSMTAISSNANPPWNGWDMRFEILGKPASEDQRGSINLVNPGYFAAIQIPLLEGRIWSDTETRHAAHVAVINRTLAQRYFPNGDAIGHSVKLPTVEDSPPKILSAPNLADSWLQIVGVVGDALNDGLRNPIKPAVYVPYTLNMIPWTQILVKSDVQPLTLLRTVRSQLTAVNAEQQTYSEVQDLEQFVSDQSEWQQEHLAAWIFGIFAALALALAAVGLYSVVSYTVLQRTNEFGIRMALGAQRSHVLQIVFASTLASVGGGIAAGLALSLGLSKILEQWAQGSSRDPITLLAGVALLSAVAALASAMPARHAAKVDPMMALRCE
ncbi:MAG TPA: ABC transporter permease [Candidatus Sulfotelmatobacter sp.]|nr:ABC transporter permease [Candidatus Sulfotelmatobacter sp.]